MLIKVVNDNTTQHSIAHPTDAMSQLLFPDRKDDVEVVVLKEARGWTQFQAKLMTTARVFSHMFCIGSLKGFEVAAMPGNA